ncbi:MAG: hypothetical protein BJ554DRAFT_4286 [Olpidium bornovanus]|uniref:Uncharacterized protein n=1 Tax=Olpidium bornovanus TaxID=278681 RepID=A0A8H7ZMC1_9FUNG|nr:MAG: hypothetical protein BJ554DRAFT_4286 [Olpidium bornovanus]
MTGGQTFFTPDTGLHPNGLTQHSTKTLNPMFRLRGPTTKAMENPPANPGINTTASDSHHNTPPDTSGRQHIGATFSCIAYLIHRRRALVILPVDGAGNPWSLGAGMYVLSREVRCPRKHAHTTGNRQKKAKEKSSLQSHARQGS